MGRAQPSEEWTLSLRWWAAKETVDPITANNANASGSYIREGQYALIVRGIGLVQSTDGLGSNVGGATSDRVVLLWAIVRCLDGEPRLESGSLKHRTDAAFAPAVFYRAVEKARGSILRTSGWPDRRAD